MSQFTFYNFETDKPEFKPNIPLDALAAALWAYETEENALTFGEMLARVRKNKGLTQDELAAESNYRRTAIAQWETGKRIPSLVAIQVLSKILCTDKLWDAYKRDNAKRYEEAQQKINRLKNQL